MKRTRSDCDSIDGDDPETKRTKIGNNQRHDADPASAGHWSILPEELKILILIQDKTLLQTAHRVSSSWNSLALRTYEHLFHLMGWYPVIRKGKSDVQNHMV